MAITTEKNPEAPEIIIVGKGERIIRNAELFNKQKQYVPVYVKRATNCWAYLGDYRAESLSKERDTIEKHRKSRPAEEIYGILFLSQKDNFDINVSSPSFPDAHARKITEKSAITFVTTHYTRLGYKVEDRQKDNCGYDLWIEKDKEILKVEVKGSASQEQRFFLSRNERSKSADPLWRLAIVTKALETPELEILTTSEMEDKFNFDALCWECTPFP